MTNSFSRFLPLSFSVLFVVLGAFFIMDTGDRRAIRKNLIQKLLMNTSYPTVVNVCPQFP